MSDEPLNCVIHIGVHKTGTSALQAWFHQNAKKLIERGVYYRAHGLGQDSHSALVAAFKKDNITSLEGGKRRVVEMCKEAREAGCDTLLISSELLCEADVDIGAFIEGFSDCDTTAVAYVRRPDELVVSAHNQIVRDPRHRYTGSVIDKPFAYDPTYVNVLSRWMNMSSVRLVLCPYDKKQWFGGNIFSDFSHMLKIDDLSNFEPLAEDVNTSLPFLLIEVLRILNNYDIADEQREMFVQDLYQLAKVRPDIFPKTSALSTEDSTAFLQMLEESLPALRPYFRNDFDDSFLRSPLA